MTDRPLDELWDSLREATKADRTDADISRDEQAWEHINSLAGDYWD